MESFIFYSVILLWVLTLFHSFLLLLLFRQFGEVYLSSGDGISRDGLAIEDSIPKYTVFSISQKKEVSLEELVTKPSVILFLSPNCKPCQEMITDWNYTEAEYKGRINFITIIVGEEKKLRSMLNKNVIGGEILWDKNKELFYLFKVRVTPFAFVVDEYGGVKDKGLCGRKEQLELYLDSVKVNKN
ncbi:thiol-disulfide isomerase/thioredoxin [Evansella vedderi]|uniref:Thiol-disulfide isomerase/thioredoxin n=1 Tax=Evansella vedderi TaxID=38282 RepID=A0ABU0A011_9BACI|nr:redoxin domain-containing protein [Evansella vedderi]MDQ0256828.1 thiol-disulfide isomerase/thioredoxin [Evansella vedderi]